MGAVAEHIELRSGNPLEVVEFVRTHLDGLKDKRLDVRGTDTGFYIVEVYSTAEPD